MGKHRELTRHCLVGINLSHLEKICALSLSVGEFYNDSDAGPAIRHIKTLSY